MMRKRISIFLVTFFLGFAAWQCECIAVENLVITTFYPSPSGEYHTVDVARHAQINMDLTLGQNGILENQAANRTTINAAGLITTPNFYSTANVYVRSLRAYEMDVTPSHIISPNWQVFNWHTDYSFWQFPPISSLRAIDCGGGFINSLDVVSGVLPVCIGIPIHLPLVLVICTGVESFNWDYKCINP